MFSMHLPTVTFGKYILYNSIVFVCLLSKEEKAMFAFFPGIKQLILNCFLAFCGILSIFVTSGTSYSPDRRMQVFVNNPVYRLVNAFS